MRLDQRADVAVSSRGSPWRIAAARSRNRSRNASRDAVLHEDPDGGEADLAGVVELLDGQVDGEVEVGVVEDEQRRLAAELEGHRRDVARRRLAPILLAVGTEPVKQIRRTSGCATSGAPASAPDALHDVEDTGGQPGLARDVGEAATR